MHHRPIRTAPDFTTAFLCVAWVWILIVLMTVWAAWGYGAALLVAAAAYAILERVPNGR
jgi:hypothetical protein